MTNTKTERRLAITPGECVMQKHPTQHAAMLSCPGWTQLAIVFGHKDEDLDAQGFANAALYADAHNTYNACHLTPSEMLEKYTQAVNLLRTVDNANAEYYGIHDVTKFLSNLPTP